MVVPNVSDLSKSTVQLKKVIFVADHLPILKSVKFI